jgi:hypothetical protein
MGFLDWFRGDKKITDFTAAELAREESRLQIRESQAASKLDRLDGERQEVFRRGFDIKSPARRRILARKFEEKKAEMGLVERDLRRLSKEIMTVSALHHLQGRRGKEKDGVLSALERADEAELQVLFEDDRISEEIYREKLNAILGISADEALGAEDDLGAEGRSVLEVWERMDEGEIGSVSAGLDEAEKIGERLREDSEGAAP